MSMLNSLPNDKILGSSALKPLADDKIISAEKSNFVFRKGRKHCG